jgi:4-amino-4-deoxy-L-arabinose transferase-like glycosyltransferase
MLQIQSIIHKLEVGGGLRHLKWFLLTLALLALILSYNFRGFKDMNTLEAMDSAQLARNLAERKGFSTLFIRPFSVYLLQKAYADKHGPPSVGDLSDRGQLHTMHPDLANPPVYPLLLAGMMKVAPGLRYQAAGATTLNIGSKHLNIWNFNGGFWIYPPDFWISLFNQFLFMVMMVMVFFFARRLFDTVVAWTSAILFLGTDLFWRFSISGLSTMLVMLIFLSLAWCLMVLEQNAREAKMAPKRLLLLGAAVGAIVGIGCLTRYSFGWLIVPVLLYLFLFLGAQRLPLCMAALAAFVVVITPWVIRNYYVSHTPFGVAGYAMYANTAYFPAYRLERSLSPDLTRVYYIHIWAKFVANIQTILQDDLPKLGGNWISGFFLVGLLINFKDPTRSRLRYFLFFCLPVLVVAQALGRTQLSEDSPVVNSENLIVLVSPLVLVFGVSLFYILLDQINFPIVQLRYLVMGAFCVIICLPAIFSFVSPRVNAVAYPPYFPPVIQKTANWMKPDELMMSDIPWAVAWYGERQCMWLTLNAQSEFFSVYDYQKQIKALYLTPSTMDSRFLSQWVRAGESSWGSFALESMLKKELPPYFPLRRAPAGFLPEQFFLTDKERWLQPAPTPAP